MISSTTMSRTQETSTTAYDYITPAFTIGAATMSSTTKSTVTTSVVPSHLADRTGLDFLIPCMNVGDSLTGVREAIAWTVAAVSMVLFVVSLTVNITMLWLRYKKRQAKDNNVEVPMYEMEGNPCYEAASMKQTTDSTGVQEVHLYERMNQNETN